MKIFNSFKDEEITVKLKDKEEKINGKLRLAWIKRLSKIILFHVGMSRMRDMCYSTVLKEITKT